MELSDITLQPGDAEKLLAAKPKRRVHRHPRGDWFLWGPIPGEWIGAAAMLPGRTLHVALAVWLVAKRSKDRTGALSHTATDRLGITRHTVARSLERLESAGLVRVHRHRGRAPRVEILLPEVGGPTTWAPKCSNAYGVAGLSRS